MKNPFLQPGAAPKPPPPRLCGWCRKPGHNKRNCPDKREHDAKEEAAEAARLAARREELRAQYGPSAYLFASIPVHPSTASTGAAAVAAGSEPRRENGDSTPHHPTDGAASASPSDQEQDGNSEKEPPHRALTRIVSVQDALHPALRGNEAVLRGYDKYLERSMQIRLQGQLRFHHHILGTLEPIAQAFLEADSEEKLRDAWDKATEYHQSAELEPRNVREAYRGARDRKPVGDGVDKDAFCVTFDVDEDGEVTRTDLQVPLDDDVETRTFPHWELHIRRSLAEKVPQLVHWRLEECLAADCERRAAIIRWWKRVWTRAIRMSAFTVFHDGTVSFPDPAPRKTATPNPDPDTDEHSDEIIGEYEDPEEAAAPADASSRPASYQFVAKSIAQSILRRFVEKREPLSQAPDEFASCCRALRLKVPGITGKWSEVTAVDGQTGTTWTAWAASGFRGSEEWNKIYHPMLVTFEREVVVARCAVGNHPKTQSTPKPPDPNLKPAPLRPRPIPMKVGDRKIAHLALFLPYAAYLAAVGRQCEQAAKNAPKPPQRRCRRRPRNIPRSRRRRRRGGKHHGRRRGRRHRARVRPAMRAFTLMPVPRPARVPFFRLTKTAMRLPSGNPSGLLRTINREIARTTGSNVHCIVEEYERRHGPPAKDKFCPPHDAQRPVAAPPTAYGLGEDPNEAHPGARWWEPLFGGLRRRHLKPMSERGYFLRSILTDGLQLRLCFSTKMEAGRMSAGNKGKLRPDQKAKLEASRPHREKAKDDIWTNVPNRTTRQAIRTRKPAPEELQNPATPVPTCESGSLGEALAQFQSQDEVQAFFGRFDALAAADPGIRNLQSVVTVALRGTDLPRRLADLWERCRARDVSWAPEAWKTILDSCTLSPVWNWTGRHAQEHCRTRQTRFRERKHRARCGIGSVFRKLPSLKTGQGSQMELLEEYSLILLQEWPRFRQYAFGCSARMRNDRALRCGAKKRHINFGARDMVRFVMQHCTRWEAGGGREEDCKILLAMGAAVTRPGMAGHAPAPHRGILEELDRNWPNVALILTDEFRTSKCHWACGGELQQQEASTVRAEGTDEHGRPVIPDGRSVRFQRWFQRRCAAIERRGNLPQDRRPLPYPKHPHVGEKDRIQAKRDDKAYAMWLSTPEGEAATVPVEANGRSSSRVFRCPTGCCGPHNIDRDVNGALNILMHLLTTLLGQRRREGFERKWEIEQREQRGSAP